MFGGGYNDDNDDGHVCFSSGVCDDNEIDGCTDFNALNFNPNATDADGSCFYLGCTYPEATNYDPVANFDNGICEFIGSTDSCPTDINEDGITSAADVLNLLANYGELCD